MSLAVRPPETIPKQSSFAAGGRGSFARAPVASEAVAKIISARTVMELHFDPNSFNVCRRQALRDAFDENAPHHESAKEEVGTGYSAPVVTPNAPSAPVWSLASQHASEQPPAHVEAKIEAAPPPSSNGAKVDEEAASIETAPAQVGASDATGQPTRKGWWQRPFRLRD